MIWLPPGRLFSVPPSRQPAMKTTAPLSESAANAEILGLRWKRPSSVAALWRLGSGDGPAGAGRLAGVLERRMNMKAEIQNPKSGSNPGDCLAVTARNSSASSMGLGREHTHSAAKPQLNPRAPSLTAEDAKVLAKAAKEAGSLRPSASTSAPFALRNFVAACKQFRLLQCRVRKGRLRVLVERSGARV